MDGIDVAVVAVVVVVVVATGLGNGPSAEFTKYEKRGAKGRVRG